jgi:hypothetical protein
MMQCLFRYCQSYVEQRGTLDRVILHRKFCGFVDVPQTTCFTWQHLWFVFRTSSYRISSGLPAVLSDIYLGFAVYVQSRAASLEVLPSSCTSRPTVGRYASLEHVADSVVK